MRYNLEHSFQIVYLYFMNKKESILASALKLLTEKGVHNTPMSAIAKAAGTGMGTIYNYFPNKDILINEIYISIKNKEKEIFLEFDINKPIKTQFEYYFTAIIDFFVQNPSNFMFMEQLQASPIITEEIRTEGSKAIEPVKELLITGKQQRIIKTIAVDELLMFIGGAVLSYLRWYFNQTEIKKSSLKNQIELVWDGIKA